MVNSSTRGRSRTGIRAFVSTLQFLILLGISASLGAGIALFISLSGVIPELDEIEAPEATIIYSSDNVVLARMFRENRTNVPLNEIPRHLRDATIAVEDKRFYSHSGVDMKGIARAVWANLRGQRLSQGGSTITQQLARNVYLTRKKTVQRKLQEAVLAILLERHFSKDKILELYLNRVYYGSGAFGVQAAARVYFGKDVDRLSLAQCAMIAGMPQKPSGYSPHEDREAAVKRRNFVLEQMAELGYITPEQRDAAKGEPLHIVPRAAGRQAFRAPHFVDYVTKQLKELYGDDVLYGGGLRVYTALSYKMQKIAEDALRNGVRRYERSRRVTEGCFVAVEAKTGYIRAMVGSVDPNSHFNRCTQGLGQQPGSAFKVFVYTAAFAEGGMTPRTTISNARVRYPGASGREWYPRNYNGKYGGSYRIKDAVAYSVNIPAIRVADKIGMQTVIRYAKLMGIRTEIQPYLSSAIGASEVHPLDMAAAYATLANDGAYAEPIAIVRIANSRGEVLGEFPPRPTPVISKKVCEMMDECLRAVVTYGTGTSARAVPDARGKTGTTNEDRDAWFIGYVPHKMSAACWVGNDDNSPMRRSYGGLVCAPIWREFMLKAIPIYDEIQRSKAARTRPPEQVREKPREEPFPDVEQPVEPVPSEPDAVPTAEPETAEYAVCDETGLLATENCPSHLQRFARGRQPRSYCNVHRRPAPPEVRDNPVDIADERETTMVTVTVCSQSGLLAGPRCPNRITRKLPVDAVPTQVCNIHQPTGR